MGATESAFGSEAVTRGFRVTVRSRFDPARSRPSAGQWFFLYTITIANEGRETARLVSRHWLIRDADGRTEEVRGPGVVGETPTLASGESFEYTSGCPLATEVGSMRGTYQMVTAGGEHFEVEIAEFTLSPPYTVH